MLIKEIEPIDVFGQNMFNQKRPNKLIDEIIELPLRKACKIFRRKGVQTVMSSANKNNVLQPGETPVEKEDVRGREFFYPAPNFSDAGHGYAWIMLNFDTLSNKNKDWLFSLEERTNEKGDHIGERAVWFIHPFRMGNIDFKLRTGELTYDFLESALSPDEIPQGIKKDERLAKFEQKSFVLAYNDRYPSNTVMLRMPINGATTVDEVENYFTKLAKSFKKQRVIRNIKEGFCSSFHTVKKNFTFKRKPKTKKSTTSPSLDKTPSVLKVPRSNITIVVNENGLGEWEK